jgi:hypothetical protein
MAGQDHLREAAARSAGPARNGESTNQLLKGRRGTDYLIVRSISFSVMTS